MEREFSNSHSVASWQYRVLSLEDVGFQQRLYRSLPKQLAGFPSFGGWRGSLSMQKLLSRRLGQQVGRGDQDPSAT